jgi:hypothetical protein
MVDGHISAIILDGICKNKKNIDKGLLLFNVTLTCPTLATEILVTLTCPMERSVS